MWENSPYIQKLKSLVIKEVIKKANQKPFLIKNIAFCNVKLEYG